jgi:hypothetical protein
MGIREAHALGGKLIEPGSGDSGLAIVAADVAVAEVVREDVQDVRPRGGIRRAGLGKR